jgi:predicted cobalt transporter CbtA
MGIGDLLRRGLAAGAAAGVAAALMLWLVVEPVLRRALKVEDARIAAEDAATAAAGGHVHAEEPVVSRVGQVLGGMGTEIVVGMLFGLAFAVVFAKVRHRLPAATDYGRSVILAALGFGVFVIAPTLKIPGNPPAVGDPDTVNRRTLLWVLTILIALALVFGAFAFDEYLSRTSLTPASRITLVFAAFVLVAGVLIAFTPDSPDTIAADMGAQIVWDFRLASVGQLAMLWGTLGTIFGLLMTRKPTAAEQIREAVAA